MSLNILICDDSSFARKQIVRALPPEWDVVIHHADNGRDGLAAIREGKGEVVFLDLNMPSLDGYGVLENIQKEGLSTQVIVISGDIQPEAQAQVRKLGAIGFVPKPISSEAAREALIKFGFLTETGA